MRNHLEKLETFLEVHRPQYLAEFNSGCSGQEISDFQKALGLSLPEDFKSLYSWRNGQQSFTALYNNLTLMPIQDILEIKTMLNDCLDAGEFEYKNQWSKSWVPFLENGAGSYVCLDVDVEFEGVKNQIIEFWKADFDRSIIFQSIGHWLNTYVTAFEKGYYHEDENGLYCPFRKHEDDWNNLYQKLNPGYPITYHVN